MITRIKYTKQQDNTLLSDKTFLYNGVKNRILIDPSTMTFSIGTPDTFVSTGKAETMHKIKRLVKKELKRLGFEFKNETRDRPLKPRVVKTNEQT
jgi:hypothetical protein